MRTFFLRAVLGAVTAVAAACGGESSRALLSRDVVPDRAEGCVVPGAEASAAGPRTWRVRPGDSLRRIARRAYGDERLWTAVRDANARAVRPGDVLLPGTELVLPYEGL